MSKKIKYLYLDDNDKITRDGDVELFNTISTRIEITTDYPSSWRQRSETIFTEIEELDGIILDWEFTNKSEEAKYGSSQSEDVDFSAESFAEHLRINVVKSKIKDIPIIICSADRNKAFTEILKKELTSRDLFDLTFIKSDLFDKQVYTSESQLYDLAIGYAQLQNSQFNLQEILALSNEELPYVDIRFIDKLDNLAKTKTTHDLVNFLLRGFIFREGPLINEYVLAARLGVDIKQSCENWNWLKQRAIDSNLIYSGIFSNGWQVFWSFKLVNWWQDNFPGIDLRTTAAPKRIELLNEKFNTKLIAAEKLKFASSDEFWTICRGTGRPLDPLNGYIISETSPNPWLELEYVSAIAELEKQGDEKWRINIIDRERFNKFKSMITKK